MESISEDKLLFESMTEKQLMIEALMTLSATIRRIDRINEKMSWLVDCRRYIQELQAEIQKLCENNNTLKKQIVDYETQFQHVYNSTTQLGQLLKKLNESINHVDSLQNKVYSISQNSEEQMQKLRNVHHSISVVIKDISLFLDNYADGPLSKIDDMNETINNLQSDISSIQNDIDDINNKMYYINSDLSNIKDDVYTSKGKISDVYEKVDDTLDHFGLYSIPRALEEIKDIVEDIKDRS